MVPNWQKVGCILALAVSLSLVVIYILWRQLSITLTLAAFSHLVGNLEELGWNPFLARGVVALACIPFFLALSQLLRLPILQRRPTAALRTSCWLVVAAYVVGYFFAMYLASRDANFGPYKRYYVWTAAGVRFAYAPGIDPISGRERQPVTPHFVATYERWTKGIVPKRVSPDSLADAPLFDPVSQQPKFWYANRAGGQVVLYDGVGFDEASGLPLEAITPEIAVLYDRQADQRRAAATAEARAAEEHERQRREELARVDSERAVAAERERLSSERSSRAAKARADFQRYVAQESAGPKGVAVLIVDQGGRIDLATGSALATALGGSAAVFRAALVSDGLFEAVRQGDPSKLRALGIQRFARVIVLGVRQVAVRAAADLHQDLVSAEARISVVIVSGRTFSLETVEASATGAAFSKGEAEAKALHAAAEQIVGRIGARIPRVSSLGDCNRGRLDVDICGARGAPHYLASASSCHLRPCQGHGSLRERTEALRRVSSRGRGWAARALGSWLG